MSETASELGIREGRAARRLARLFRVERSDRVARRPADAMWRLIRRRRRLLEELMCLDAERRLRDAPVSPDLNAAIAELSREVARAQEFCMARIEQLGDELHRRQGGGITTGLRHSAGGQLLGHG